MSHPYLELFRAWKVYAVSLKQQKKVQRVSFGEKKKKANFRITNKILPLLKICTLFLFHV